MKIIHSILILTIINATFCITGNKVQASLSAKSKTSTTWADESISRAVAKNGGYYLPDNAVNK